MKVIWYILSEISMLNYHYGFFFTLMKIVNIDFLRRKYNLLSEPAPTLWKQYEKGWQHHLCI